MVPGIARKAGLAVIITALVAGCGDKKDEGGAAGKAAAPVAAKVNDSELTASQVEFALQRMPNLDKEQAKAAGLQVVRNLVDQEVLAQQARTDKLDQDAAVVQALDAARRQILAEAYLARKLGTPVEPGEAEVAAYFEKHPELFGQRKVYRLQELSISAAQDRHEAIRAQLAASKTLNDFAAWLKAENLPFKAAQGVKAAEQLPEGMRAKISAMPDGQAMIVNAPEGLLVIVLAGSQLQPVTLEQARPAIVRLLKNEARQKAAKAELDRLKAAAKIEYLGEYADAAKLDSSAPVSPAAEAATPPAQ